VTALFAPLLSLAAISRWLNAWDAYGRWSCNLAVSPALAADFN